MNLIKPKTYHIFIPGAENIKPGVVNIGESSVTLKFLVEIGKIDYP